MLYHYKNDNDGWKEEKSYYERELSTIGKSAVFILQSKLYKPNTLNIDLILWHTQLIVCAENVKSWFKSWFISCPIH